VGGVDVGADRLVEPCGVLVIQVDRVLDPGDGDGDDDDVVASVPSRSSTR